jgi:hypothetical protein
MMIVTNQENLIFFSKGKINSAFFSSLFFKIKKCIPDIKIKTTKKK